MKRTWPHLHYIFSPFCLHFLSPLFMSHYLHTPFALFFSSFLFISDLHLSIFSSISTSQHTQYNSLISRAQEEERENQKSKREKEKSRWCLFCWKSSAASTSTYRALSLLCFAFKYCININIIFFILKKQSPFAYRSCSLCLPCRKVIFLPRTFSSFVKTHVFVFCVYFFYIQFLY